MCTVTFLPLPEHNFILSSNRDEKEERPKALFPSYKQNNWTEILYPKDGKAGGTWIATGLNQRTVCLLNGAFEKHIKAPTYRHSRGLVPLDFFEFDTTERFVDSYNLENIEPFTIVILEHTDQLCLKELIWDGSKKHFSILDETQPKIWSSVTLYSPGVVQKRYDWFQSFLGSKNLTVEEIRDFHHFGGEGELSEDIRMVREDGMGTVSVTSIEKSIDGINMIYEDIRAGTIFSEKLIFS